VISAGVGAVAQHRIIEQQRESGDRAIEAVASLGPPVVFSQDEFEIFGGDGLQARILRDDGFGILRQSEAEGIGVRRQRDEQQRRADAPLRSRGRAILFAAGACQTRHYGTGLPVGVAVRIGEAQR